MATVNSRTFQSGNSVALRLPREIAYAPGVEVTVTRSGDTLTVQPKRPSLREMVDELRRTPKPITPETRDVELLPEPRHLFR